MEDEDGGGQTKTDHNKIGEEEDEKISSSNNKGKGLKKWKRIQRTTITAKNSSPANTSPSAEEDDLHRFLKRDSRRFALPHTAGGDSDNSEGKSSTAASVPTKFRNSRNHRTGTSVNRPKNKIEETSKKLRGGGGGDNDRDVSYSSVESDLRSSNFFSNGGGRRLHYDDADHSSEVQTSDQQSNHYEEEVSASATVNAPSSSQDLLSDAIVSLHAVHQALQKEIQSFGEIGKEAVVLKADELVFEEEVKGKERELLREDWKWREMEQLFAHKVEAEVQCLVIRQKFKEQNKNKNTALLLHTEEDEDPLKLRSAASKYGYFFCVQFIILFVVLLRLLFLQLWPGSTGFVPT